MQTYQDIPHMQYWHTWIFSEERKAYKNIINQAVGSPGSTSWLQ